MSKETTKLWKQNHKEQVREAQRNLIIRYRTGWDEWFINNGYEPTNLQEDYHHTLPEIKLFGIGRWVSSRPPTSNNIELIRAELEKCVHLTRANHMRTHRTHHPLKA